MMGFRNFIKRKGKGAATLFCCYCGKGMVKTSALDVKDGILLTYACFNCHSTASCLDRQHQPNVLNISHSVTFWKGLK